jgi:hypothetical protein
VAYGLPSGFSGRVHAKLETKLHGIPPFYLRNLNYTPFARCLLLAHFYRSPRRTNSVAIRGEADIPSERSKPACRASVD